MDGNALEVALALMRLPSMRVPLRLQPLPDDVEQLIVLASGTAAPLAAAVARTGEPAEQLLEAARFYIHEVMLFTGADAYRVLGVSTDATEDQIKLHFRHLQHWLHPDRGGNALESVFAARVNHAWGELRTPARRAAYDARVLSEASAPHRVLVNEWRPTPAAGGVRWRGGLLLAGAVALCLWLAWLAQRQANAPAPAWEPATESHPLAEQALLPVSKAEEQAFVEPLMLAGSALAVEADRPDHDVSPSVVAAAPASVMAESGWVLDRPAQAAPVRELQKQIPVVAVVAAPTQSSRTASQPSAPPLATATTAPPEPAAPTRTVSLEQMQLAQRRGRELIRFLASHAERAPPIWRNAAAQDAATSLRDRIQGERVQFAAPDWRIAGERASMTSALQQHGNTDSAATLRAELAWHDGMWLVDRIEMEGLP